MNRLVFHLVLGMPLVLASVAAGVTPATLVGPDLEPRTVMLSSLRDGQLAVFDADRTLRTLGPGDYLQLRFDEKREGATLQNAAEAPARTNNTAQSVPTTWLMLTDGRLLPGKLAGFEEDGQVIRWTHPALIDEARINLDQVAVLSFTGPVSADAQASENDRVTLVNGDVLVGFILALNADGLELQIEGVDTTTKLPLDRLSLVRFANAKTQPPADQHIITLADGTRLYASALTIESDTLAVTGVLPGRPQLLQNLPLEKVRRIDFATAGLRLVELADQPWRTLSGGEVFGRPIPPRLRAGVLHLHAPVSLAFALPGGTRRFAARAALDLEGVSASAAAWADLELIVRQGGREIARHHLTAENPAATLNLPTGPGELVIELDTAANGPILDRLRLSDAVILIGTN